MNLEKEIYLASASSHLGDKIYEISNQNLIRDLAGIINLEEVLTIIK